jgi:hypothetical protein
MAMHAEQDFGDMHVVMDWYTTPKDENVTLTVTTPSWRGQYTSHVILPLDVLEWVVQNFQRDEADQPPPPTRPSAEAWERMMPRRPATTEVETVQLVRMLMNQLRATATGSNFLTHEDMRALDLAKAWLGETS